MSDDPEESAYYLRLVSMYIDIGTETVLGVFVHHSPGKDAETFLKANQNGIIKLKTDHTLNEQECSSLLQKGTHVLKNPLDLNRFDVSLLITLARNLFTSQQLPPPAKGWKYPPKNKDKSVAADLIRLRTTRNVIVGHHPRARLPKWRFDDEWQKVSEIILRLQQQISPGNVVHIKERIETYRLQRLDPRVENKYDEKLKEWHKEVAEVQDQVEELIKKLEGFDAYFKTKSDRFERYTKLLFTGGHFVLSALLSKKIEKDGRDLRSLLDENKDTLKTNITDPKQLDILYPPTNKTDPLDISSWDVSLLATVILQLFVSTKDRSIKRNVKRIGDAHKNYADSALVALDSNTFEDYWTDLKASIEIVSYKLDESKADRCYQILEECKKKISEREFQTYMDELKKQGSEMKTFSDIFKDTLQKTKDFLQDMITHGISFKNGHELELKMITLGNNEEKKKLAEEILTEVWHEALDRSIQATDFPEVKKEVEKILDEIKMSKSVKNITIKTACILLQITCTSPSDILNMMNYFESKRFHESLVNISKELGYYFDTALTVYSVVPIDCLWAISNFQSEFIKPKERGVRLPITVSSPAGMKQLISLCGSEKIANSTNSIADALSKHLDDTIELKTSTDMKELGYVFHADKSSSDSGSDCSSMESSVQNSNQLNQPDVPEECPEGRSLGNMHEESTEQELDDKTDHPKEGHKDNSIKKETEPVTIPTDIYTVESSDPDGSDWAFPWKKRETNIQRYRNWVRAGLALHIFKTELNTICDEAVGRQHKELIETVKMKKGLLSASCNKCNLQTLLPDHVQTEIKQCPLGYLNCNCLNPVGKSACPNNLCSALYDDIIRLYKSKSPTPFWKNTNVQTWCTDPWSIAKCFISKSGYASKTKASDFDIKELILLRKNNKELIKAGDIYEDKLLQVCRHRDSLYYSKEMELDWSTAFEYRRAFEYSMTPFRIHVPKFLDDDYIVTTKDEALVHTDVIGALIEEAKYLEQKIGSNEETNISEKEIEDDEFPAKKHIHDAEEYKIRLKKIKTLISVHKEKMAYIDSKFDLQKRLVKLYRDHVVKVPALPIQPEQNQKDIDDVYVDPWMTVLEEDEPNRKASELREKEISSFFEVFKERGNPIKNVYVLGEAGTGKSIFCKSLVQKWCKVHMENDVAERLDLKGFEFLFFILLRHHLDKPTIKMMLDSQYGHPSLQKILDTESDKCLILLDGLDEWIPKSLSHSQIRNEAFPMRDITKDYTVVTTSRPWKIGILCMKTNEVHQKVMLRGIKKSALKILTEKTMTLLNAMFKQDKTSLNFIKYLKTSPMSDIQHIPILLQQLICLWYENNNLTSSSKSTLYGDMLELPFKWLDQRKREGHESDVGSEAVQIPHALDKVGMYHDYKRTLQSASKLAFEIMFKHEKEHTLSFDFQTCKRLQIPVDVLKVCVNIGILSEDKNIGFSTDVLNESSFSFVHKSIQEFLAALHIAETLSLPASELVDKPSSHPMIELEYTTSLRHQSKLDDMTFLRPVSEQGTHLSDMSGRKYSGWSNVFGDFMQKYCAGIRTVENILELANVFIFLSGLQPNLVTTISKYIHTIVNQDILVRRHRTTLEECAFLNDIQACLSSCCHEASSNSQCDQCPIYLGDCFLDDLKSVHPSLNISVVQQIIPDSIKSLSFSFSQTCPLYSGRSKCDICSVLTYFSSCDRLAKIDLNDKRLRTDDRHTQLIIEILKTNVQTLRTVSVDFIFGVCLKGMFFEPLIKSIRKLNWLTSLEVQGIRLSHKHCGFLTSYLANKVRLQELSLNIVCERKDDHKIDMSRHDTLQYLEIGDGFTVMNVNTKHDMTMKFKITRSDDSSIKPIFRILESVKLKHVSLWGNRQDDSVPAVVTHKLCSLLAQANYLCAIELDSLEITRNILTSPLKLINLKRIDLSLITMTILAWEAFIDSLPCIPNAVHVKTLGLVIKDTADMRTPSSMLYERKTKLPIPSEALDYVRNQDELFHVTRDEDYLFEFSTHKYQHW